jgi:hypothetical protein
MFFGSWSQRLRVVVVFVALNHVAAGVDRRNGPISIPWRRADHADPVGIPTS